MKPEFELVLTPLPNDRTFAYRANLYMDDKFLDYTFTTTRWGAKWWAKTIKFYYNHPSWFDRDMSERRYRI